MTDREAALENRCDQLEARTDTLLEELGQERALRRAAEQALAEERQAREQEDREYALLRDECDQKDADLAACEARLAETEQWRDFYQSALRRGRTAFDAGDMKEARTAFSCGLVSAPNEQDLAWAKAWLATEEGQQVLAEVQQAHPAPPPVDRIAPEDRSDGPACG